MSYPRLPFPWLVVTPNPIAFYLLNIFLIWPLLHHSYHQCFCSSSHHFLLKLLQLSPNGSLWYQPCYLHTWVFYTAVRMICLKPKTDHVNPQLKNFQWFSTASRIKPRFLSKALMIPKHISVLVLTKFNWNEVCIWLSSLLDSGLFKGRDKVFSFCISASSSDRKKLLNLNEMVTSGLKSGGPAHTF